MRVLAGASALLLLVVTLPPSGAVGGVLVAGVGVGDTYLPNGQPFCSGHPFHAEALYVPGGKGILRVDYYPGPSCQMSNGGGMFVGHSPIDPSANPPITFVFACSGTEGTGMYCSGTDNFGQYGWGQVGPYGGPGGSVSVAFASPTRTLRGFFTAI